MLTSQSQIQVQDKSAFISKVYGLLALSLFFAATGAYLGLSMSVDMFFPVMIINFILLLACMFLGRNYPLNIVLLGSFTWTSGMTIGMSSLQYVRLLGQTDIIPVAVGITGIVFASLSSYALVSKKDFSFLSGYLFVALISMVLFGFVTMLFHIAFNTMIYSAIGILVFSGYVLYDTSNLLYRYDDNAYVAATIALYLDILNLFLFILRILSGSSSRR